MPAMLLFFNYKLWLLGYVSTASLRRDAGKNLRPQPVLVRLG